MMVLLDVNIGWWEVEIEPGVPDGERTFKTTCTIEIEGWWGLLDLSKRADRVRAGMKGAGHRWVGLGEDGGWRWPWQRIVWRPRVSMLDWPACPKD